MSISIKLREYLESRDVRFEHHVHPTAYTAQETAEAMHVPGKDFAKTVVIKADGALLLAVIPADRKVNLHHLQFVTRSEYIEIATESDFKEAFPTCEVGAMPPFGLLWGLTTYCDTRLELNDYIEFNAGTHNDTIRMSFWDFKKHANPTMLDLVVHPQNRVA